MRASTWVLLAALVGCTGGSASTEGTDTTEAEPAGFEPPVLVNAEPPIGYPPTLYENGVEGSVVLRLYVDDSGHVVPDSTRVAEGSGYPELDSAALAGVADFKYAPARRDGAPVSTPLLQPVQFRRPGATPAGGMP